jgi:hypothetical protein
MVTSGAKLVSATPRGSHTSGASHIALLECVCRKDGPKLRAQSCCPEEKAPEKGGGRRRRRELDKFLFLLYWFTVGL